MSDEIYVFKNGLRLEDINLSNRLRQLIELQPENSNMVDRESYTWDEAGLSEIFIDIYQDTCRYCPQKKSWMSYDGRRWVKDEGSLIVSSKVKEFVSLLRLYVLYEMEDNDTKKAYEKFINTKLGDRRYRERIIKDAMDVLPISASMFDDKPNLINCLNGTYDLSINKFRPHDWHDYLTMMTRFNYVFEYEEKPICDRWVKFIDEIMKGDTEKADYLQRALGYSIVGSSKEECMFIMYGATTRNGKSTLSATIHNMMGDYAYEANATIICKGSFKNGENASPTIAALKGKRIVFMQETSANDKFDSQVIKQLTGGEAITARNLYESMTTFLPQFTMWLSCNDKPDVNDRSLFTSDRLRLIEFNKHFSANERDKNLKDIFRTDEAMSGIFTWLIQGYNKYKNKGVEMEGEILATAKEYEKENDYIYQFLNDTCIKQPEGQLTLKTLFDKYKEWCKENNYFPLGKKKFSSGLSSHNDWVSKITRTHEGTSVFGVVLYGTNK